MPCTPSSPSGHQALTVSRPETLLRVPARGGVPHSDTNLPKEACLSTFQITDMWSYSVLTVVLGVKNGERNGNPLQYSCLENPVNRGAWWAAIYGVFQA